MLKNIIEIIFILALWVLVLQLLLWPSSSNSQELEGRKPLSVEYITYAVVNATEINTNFVIACDQVYKIALADGQVETFYYQQKWFPIQRNLSTIYRTCISYWEYRESIIKN